MIKLPLQLCYVCSLSLGSLNAQAAQWLVDPYINSGVTYNDNVFFTTDQPVDSMGIQALTGINLNRNTETLSTRLSASLFAREYEDDALIDSVDSSLVFDSKRLGERYQLGLFADYKHQTTTISELEVTGPVQLDRRVDKVTVRPSWQYQISPLASMQLSYTWSDADFDALPTEFSDYTNQVLQLGYQQGLTERTSLGLQFQYSELDVPDTGVVGLPGVKSITTSESAFLVFNHRFSETLKLDMQVGNRDTEEKVTFVPVPGQPVTINKGDGRLYSFSLNKSDETLSGNFSARRDLTPASDGQLNETETLRLDVNWSSDKRNMLTFTIGQIKTKPAISTSQAASRYTWVQPSYSYRLGERSKLVALYRYARQRADNNADAVEANSLSISLNYSWPRTELK